MTVRQKKKILREKKDKDGRDSKAEAGLCFLPRFHPSGLGFYAGFPLQVAALEAWCCNSGQADTVSLSHPELLCSRKACKKHPCSAFAVQHSWETNSRDGPVK